MKRKLSSISDNTTTKKIKKSDNKIIIIDDISIR